MVCAFWFSLSVWVNGDTTFSFGSLTRIGFNRRPSIMLLLLLLRVSSSSLPQSKQTATRTTAVDRLLHAIGGTSSSSLLDVCVGVGCICKDGCVVFRHEIVGCIPRFSSSLTFFFLWFQLGPTRKWKKKKIRSSIIHFYDDCWPCPAWLGRLVVVVGDRFFTTVSWWWNSKTFPTLMSSRGLFDVYNENQACGFRFPFFLLLL